MVTRAPSSRRAWLLASVAAIGVSALVSGCAGRTVTSATAGGGNALAPTCSQSTRSAAAPTSSHPAPSAVTVEAPTGGQLDQVRRWAACAALANGDTEPYKGGTAVLSTRRTAVHYLFPGEEVDNDVPVIAVEVPGKFDDRGFDPPPQAARFAPTTGNMLVIVYNLADGTGDVRLLTGGEQAADLTALGPVARF